VTTSDSKNRWLVLLGRLAMAASLVFLAVSLVASLGDLPRTQLNRASLLALLLTVALFVVTNAIGALAWGQLISRSARNTVRYAHVFRIWATSNVAKYLPGNVFHYVGRGVLAQRAGFAMGAIVTSMIVEALILCLSPLVLVALGLLTSSFRFDLVARLTSKLTSAEYVVGIGGLLVAGIAAACFFPDLRRRAIGSLAMVGIPASMTALAGYLVNFLLMGCAAKVLLDAFWHVGPSIGWYELSCGYALAFLLGYILPGAPGGIGVREAVMVGLFRGAIGTAPALGLVVLLRLASIAGDFVSFAIARGVRESAA